MDANEVRLIQTLGKHIGFKDPYGYVTSGCSEANMAALWWHKLRLLDLSRATIQ